MRAALPLLLVTAVAALAVEQRTMDPVNRYAAMMEKSPFALATVEEKPKDASESFAANWELTGLAKVRNTGGEEKEYVSIRSRDGRLAFTLIGTAESTEAEAAGVTLHSVDWQEGRRKSSVMLKKGSELANVKFGEDSAVAAPPPPNVGNPGLGAMPRPGLQGVNPNLNNVPRPAPNTAQIQRGPIVPGNMPARNQLNTGAILQGVPPTVHPQPPGFNGVAPNNADPRRRIRIINSKP
jgi:hypothetical protein